MAEGEAMAMEQAVSYALADGDPRADDGAREEPGAPG
jgi:hypothetical protein